MSDLKKCPHDDGKLVAYDESNPFKIGRVYCPDCNCAFLGEELATRGAECAFFAPTPAEPEGEPVEAAVAEEPAAVEKAAPEKAEVEPEEDKTTTRRGR